MDRIQKESFREFDIFLSKYVPHILEKIFFSLDYEYTWQFGVFTSGAAGWSISAVFFVFFSENPHGSW